MDYFVRCHTFVNEICAVLTLQQITAVIVRHLSPWTLAMCEQLFIWKSGPFVSSLHISSLLRLSTILLQLLFRLWGNGEGSMGRRAALEYSLKEKGTALQRKHGTEWRQSDAGIDSQGEGKLPARTAQCISSWCAQDHETMAAIPQGNHLCLTTGCCRSGLICLPCALMLIQQHKINAYRLFLSSPLNTKLCMK